MSADTLQDPDDYDGLAELAMDDEYDDLLNIAPSGLDEDTVMRKFGLDLKGAGADFLNCSASGSKVETEKKLTAERKAWTRSRFEDWSKTTKSGRNFLHVLAYSDRSSGASPPWLIVMAIHSNPKDIGLLDDSNRTPLTVAIASANHTFLRTFIIIAQSKLIDTQSKLVDIKKALETECAERDTNDKDVTCLHAAIHYNVRSDFTKSIIQIVPDNTFRMQDSKGRTPLHLAVEYEKCTPSQVGLVTELLDRGPRALEIKMKDSLGRYRSVYQHHEITRRQKKTLRQRGFSELKPALDKKRDESGGELLENEKKKATIKAPDLLKKDNHRKPEPGRSSIKRQESIMISPTSQESKMPQVRPQPALDMQLEERNSSADKIKEQLKLRYLRKEMPNEALRCLQLQDERAKHIWFDLGPEPKTKYSAVEFKKHFKHLKLDTVLQYVAFPQVELNYDDESSGTHRRSRRDMVILFEWLRSKGVKRIIRVIVDDLRKPAHSDEDIENALSGFEVEILNWRRLDLCPMTISKVSTSLREVHLQWSGRNAVLRGWSEPEGLAKTRSLELVQLTQVEKFDSDDRTQDNLKAFDKRLKSSWPDGRAKPVIHLPKPSGNTFHTTAKDQPPDTETNHKSERTVDPHKWMTCMHEFAECFRNIKGIKDENSNPDLNPVTVALIDDGVDITHEELLGCEVLGKSFDHSADGWRINPYWDSAVGHGTLMARLIHKICPSAVIYVIKLKTVGSNDGKLQISQESAIEAIEHATEQGAQIISMSWTIKRPTEPATFDNAIKNASTKTKPVLMFCSASDQGHFPDHTYPHSSNPNSVFRIGASKATGAFADSVGDPTTLDLAFPGHEVVVDDHAGHEHLGSRFASHTGSSVATALAAGLAALILECVRLGVISTQEAQQSDPRMAINKDDLTRIRNKRAMMDALKTIGTGQQTQNKYIEVWNTFDPITTKLKQEEGLRSNQLEVIAALAGSLLSKGVKN